MQTDGHFTLVELNYLIRQSIQHCFPQSIWVQAETSDVRTASNGHCYLEFIQKDLYTHALLAKAKGIIWSNVSKSLRPYFEKETGETFRSGIKVLVKVRVEFSELYGYSLIVEEIDPTYTIGDMVKRRKEILDRLTKEGVLNLNKELTFPMLPQRIAVISSATAAGYGDFCNQLRQNKRGIVFYTRLFPAIMQGDRIEESIIQALDKIYTCIDQWDVVVIIRGGGATSDLAGFDTYNLATSVAQFPLPIITGIGHERDDTVLDFLAHLRAKTPTAAAEILIHYMNQCAEVLERLTQSIYLLPTRRLQTEIQRIATYTQYIPTLVEKRIQTEQHKLQSKEHLLLSLWNSRRVQDSFRIESLLPRIMHAIEKKLNVETHRLALCEQKTRLLSPQHILSKGYSLTLKNGKTLKDSKDLSVGDTLVTHLAKGKIESTITQIHKKNES